MIYDFAKASVDEAVRMVAALAEELGAALRKVATGYVVTVLDNADRGDPNPYTAPVKGDPYMILLLIHRAGEAKRWSYGISVNPVSESDHLAKEAVYAFSRFKAKRDNETGVAQ